jgi:hypothetical protein
MPMSADPYATDGAPPAAPPTLGHPEAEMGSDAVELLPGQADTDGSFHSLPDSFEMAPMGRSGRFRSDHCFDDFISPVTNPFFFVDPRSLTEITGLYLDQQVPKTSPFGGGDFQFQAVQLSFAISDRLSVIVPKAGFMRMKLDGLPHDEGLADSSTGVKFAFVNNPESRLLVAGGLIYERANGDGEVLQGNGFGVFTPYVTAGKALGKMHILGAAGWHVPNDDASESQSAYYSLHLDYDSQGFYPLVEVNGIYYIKSGKELDTNMEGGDIISLGARDVAGNHFVSVAFGAAKVFNPHLIVSAAWEVPIMNRDDLLEDRLTAKLTLRY